jgi:uncharacterized membrane protein
MDKYDFLRALEARLEGLPEADKQASLDYYAEILDDLTEGGMTEEEAVASLESVESIAQEILLDMPLPKLVKAKMKPKRRLRAWEIVLIAVGSPLWFPILIALFAMALSLYITCWAVVLSLYAADLAIAAAVPAGVLSAVLLFFGGQPAGGLLFLGAALVCAGLAILLFLGCNATAKGVWMLGKLTLRGIKACFIRKERA